jgi:O-antigen ligase
MIVTAIALPALVSTRSTDMLRGLFICFSIACIANFFFLLGPPRELDVNATPGFTGYFPGKNYTGMCAAIAFILSLHEMSYRGTRRWIGLVGLLSAGTLLYISNARTAQALAATMPAFALVAVMMRRHLGTTPLALPVIIVATYMIVSLFTGVTVYRLSNIVFGNPTFTGRWAIWIFAWLQIDEKPLFGWGYQSFWLTGDGGPNEAATIRWVRDMPNAHSGYIDTIVELGMVGFVFLLAFVALTLRALGRLVDRDPRRAWCLIALAYFAVLMNGLESIWMRGFEFTWLVFLIVAVEAARRVAIPTAVRSPDRSCASTPALTPRRGYGRRSYDVGVPHA